MCMPLYVTLTNDNEEEKKKKKNCSRVFSTHVLIRPLLTQCLQKGKIEKGQKFSPSCSKRVLLILAALLVKSYTASITTSEKKKKNLREQDIIGFQISLCLTKSPNTTQHIVPLPKKPELGGPRSARVHPISTKASPTMMGCLSLSSCQKRPKKKRSQSKRQP